MTQEKDYLKNHIATVFVIDIITIIIAMILVEFSHSLYSLLLIPLHLYTSLLRIHIDKMLKWRIKWESYFIKNLSPDSAPSDFRVLLEKTMIIIFQNVFYVLVFLITFGYYIFL